MTATTAPFYWCEECRWYVHSWAIHLCPSVVAELAKLKIA